MSGLNKASFCFESLNASLDPFKKTIILFIYVLFTFKISCVVEHEVKTLNSQRYEIG